MSSESLHPEQDQRIDASNVTYPPGIKKFTRWNPFSQQKPICFYNPEHHQEIAQFLLDAPIQSHSAEDEVKSFE